MGCASSSPIQRASSGLAGGSECQFCMDQSYLKGEIQSGMGTCLCPCCEGTGVHLHKCPNRPAEGWVNLLEHHIGNGWEKVEKDDGKFRCPNGPSCDLVTDVSHSDYFSHDALPSKHESLPGKGSTFEVGGPSLMRSAMAQRRGACSNEVCANASASNPSKDTSRRPCKHGAACYQRSKDHKRAFCHPGDTDYSSWFEVFEE